MHQIRHLAIEGFWRSHDINLTLHPDVTFLIGQNGTGKTTLISLLAAALTADFRTLDRLAFKKITITLSPNEKGVSPTIILTKTKRKERTFEFVTYKITNPSKPSQETMFSLEGAEEQLAIRRLPHDPRFINDYYRHVSSGINVALQDLLIVNWLSVNRTPQAERSRDDRSYESTVDQKIETLSNDLVRYFSTLSRQKDKEIISFQQSIFVSLLEEEHKLNDFFDTKTLNALEEYQIALSQIFTELHVNDDKTKDLMAKFVQRASNVRGRVKKRENPGASVADAVVLINLKRIESIIKRWGSLQERLSGVFSQRDKFVSTANELFRRKKMEITESNELQFITGSNQRLTPQMLSSGEKQLLILLSETLLQRERPAILIADEPELSLHVLWQERLIASLRGINPSAQMIVATHSPDIVGVLAEKAIDMETLIP